MIELIASAVAPIAWVLGLGIVLRQYAGLDEALWRGLQWLSYWVFMPSLLISAIVQAPDIAVPWWPLLSSIFTTLLILTALLLAGWKVGLFGAFYPRFTSLYQGVIRFNTFIALALMAGLRPDLLPHLAIAAACTIVMVNIACVSVMTATDTQMVRAVSKELVSNPLILGCVIGGILRVLQMPSGFPITGLALVGQAALPMGVLVLGAGLRWQAIRSGLALTGYSVVLQLAVKPFLFIVLSLAFGLDPDWILVGLSLVAVSTAPSSYILAKQLGGDAPVMATIVVVQTLLSIFTIPVVLWVASQMQWIPLQ